MTAFALFVVALASVAKALAGDSTECGPKSNSPKFNFPASIRSVTEKKLGSSVQYNINFDSKELPSLKARKIPAQGKSRGTVLFLCGGPSACDKNGPVHQVPKDMDVIQFDYLGIGDNAHVKDPSKMTLEAQAEAAKAVVKALKLKNYTVTGWSFGTAVATVAAAKIASDPTLKLQQPKTVVLDSTIVSKKDGRSEFEEVSRRAWNLLSENERTQFRDLVRAYKSENPELAGGLWRLFIGEDLRRGAKFTAEDIRKCIHLGPKELFKMWKGAPGRGDLDEEFHTALYLAVGCEANNHRRKTHSGFFFEDGLISTSPLDSEEEFCKCRTSDADYDSKNYKIRAPVIYINGTADPVTPYEGARQHSQNQDQAPLKAFIAVRDGGHTSVGRYLYECLDQIYSVALAPSAESFSSLPNLGGGCPGETQSADAGGDSAAAK